MGYTSDTHSQGFKPQVLHCSSNRKACPVQFKPFLALQYSSKHDMFSMLLVLRLQLTARQVSTADEQSQ